MKTKEQQIDELMDRHIDLFSDGAEAYQSFLAGEYEGIENEYHELEANFRIQMSDIEAQIEELRNPSNHE